MFSVIYEQHRLISIRMQLYVVVVQVYTETAAAAAQQLLLRWFCNRLFSTISAARVNPDKF